MKGTPLLIGQMEYSEGPDVQNTQKAQMSRMERLLQVTSCTCQWRAITPVMWYVAAQPVLLQQTPVARKGCPAVPVGATPQPRLQPLQLLLH
jgi:hypothetical protein